MRGLFRKTNKNVGLPPGTVQFVGEKKGGLIIFLIKSIISLIRKKCDRDYR